MTPTSTILITGANRGIGFGLTRHFLNRGWHVLAACRQPGTASELAALARKSPGRCDVLALEVRSAASVASLASALAARDQPIDVLVNNAGINPLPKEHNIAEVEVAKVADALDVNALGALRVFQAVLPWLRRSARPRMVNITSGRGSLAHWPDAIPTQTIPAYCVSKAALNMVTRLAAHSVPEVTTVCVSPGWVKTDMAGPEAPLELDEATAALATTIENLKREQSGEWIDRFGKRSEFAW